MSTTEDVCGFLSQFAAMRNICGSLSQPGANKEPQNLWKKVRRSKKKRAYIICVDVPCHVSIRNELSANVASDFTVPPAAVDVNYTDHVPLRERRKF